MKTKFSPFVFAFIDLFLVVWIIFWAMFSNVKGKKDIFDTAFLNPKYEKLSCSFEKSEVKIEIKKGIEVLEIQGGIVFDEAGKKCPVSLQKVSMLLKNFSKIRNVEKNRIADFSSKIKTGLSDEDKISVRITKKGKENKEELLCELDFGNTTSLTNRLFFEKDGWIFETEDNFSHFLTLDINYWAEKNFFCLFEKPDTFGFLNIGEILSEKDFENSLPLKTKRIESGLGRVLVLKIFEKNESEYKIKLSVIPSDSDSETLKNKLTSFEYGFSIFKRNYDNFFEKM